jgi:outer membrane biosynthesis protein TonB
MRGLIAALVVAAAVFAPSAGAGWVDPVDLRNPGVEAATAQEPALDAADEAVEAEAVGEATPQPEPPRVVPPTADAAVVVPLELVSPILPAPPLPAPRPPVPEPPPATDRPPVPEPPPATSRPRVPCGGARVCA